MPEQCERCKEMEVALLQVIRDIQISIEDEKDRIATVERLNIKRAKGIIDGLMLARDILANRSAFVYKELHQ